MEPLQTHSWDLGIEEAIRLQETLARRVVKTDTLPRDIHVVAGIDVAYSKNDDQVYAGIVLFDIRADVIVETATVVSRTDFPYVPGLFAFRELPPIIEAMRTLSQKPDLVICDGQGIAHPRRFGLASHFGLLYNLPTIGCGKTKMIGQYIEPDSARGSFSQIMDRTEEIGSALRTQNGVKPLFVSIGHNISLPTAREWILRLAIRYRQTEPIRHANQLVNELRSNKLGTRHHRSTKKRA